MENKLKTGRILLITRNFKEIAELDGETHLLDSDRERASALDLAKKAILERKKLDELDSYSSCEIDILEEAMELLENGEKLQINSLFSDILAYRCRGVTLFGHHFLTGTVDVELLSEIEDGAETSHYIFHRGGGWRTHLEKESLSKAEWNAVISPLVMLGFYSHGKICAIDAAYEAAGERNAIAQTVANFESIVGPKAGTDRDLGGFEGNAKIDIAYEMGTEFRNRGSGDARGQQDCINETQTTRHLIDLLIQQGLIVYHTIAPQHSVASLKSYDHHALRLVELGHPEAMTWTVDSWVEDNGQQPEILTEADWYAKWQKVFGRK